jgi:hypothetical protein
LRYYEVVEVDPGVFGQMQRGESRIRDTIERSLLESAVQTKNYLNRRGLSVEQEVAAELYLEATCEFAKRLGSSYGRHIESMLASYYAARAKKNGQRPLF